MKCLVRIKTWITTPPLHPPCSKCIIIILMHRKSLLLISCVLEKASISFTKIHDGIILKLRNGSARSILADDCSTIGPFSSRSLTSLPVTILQALAKASGWKDWVMLIKKCQTCHKNLLYLQDDVFFYKKKSKDYALLA